ncbi:phosphotransferase [Mycoplasmatota bacterium]|nr:phosphotransferase [Mycoplasmatota bacterium]
MNENLIDLLRINYGIDITLLENNREGGSKSFIAVSRGERYLFKLVPDSFSKTIKQSLSVLNFLEENEFLSPKVVKTKSNQSFFKTEVGKIGVLFYYIDGDEVAKVDRVEDYSKIGELVGKLHKIMKEYPNELIEQDKNYFIERYICQLKQKCYEESKLSTFIEYGNYLWESVKNLPRGFCHGDLYLGNLLRDKNDTYYILDFDTSSFAFPMYDIMMVCNRTDYFEFDESGFFKSQDAYEIFLKGYLKHCELTPSEIKSFYYLIALYHFQLQATILEINGLDCINDDFIDNQLDWLLRWRNQCLDNVCDF